MLKLRRFFGFLPRFCFSNSKLEKTISKFSTPENLGKLSPELVEKFKEMETKLGFIPNFVYLLARRPAECKGFFEYHDAIMAENTSSLTKSEKEMIIVATSGLNHCQYCSIAHGAILRVYEKNPYLSDQLAINHRKTELTKRQKLILEFAIKVSKESENVKEEDYEILRQNGFTEEDIWDIISVSSFFAMSNRLANATYLKTNLEFYNLGRTFGGDKKKE